MNQWFLNFFIHVVSISRFNQKSAIKILRNGASNFVFIADITRARILHIEISQNLASTANLKPNIYRDVISPFVVSRLEHPLLRSTGHDFSPILHQNDHFRGRIQRFRASLVPEPRFYRHIIPRWLRLFQRPDVNKIVKSGWIGFFHERWMQVARSSNLQSWPIVGSFQEVSSFK